MIKSSKKVFTLRKLRTISVYSYKNPANRPFEYNETGSGKVLEFEFVTRKASRETSEGRKFIFFIKM